VIRTERKEAVVVRSSQFALAATLRQEIFQGFGVFAKAAAEAADEFGSERLENEAVFLFDEGYLGAFFDGVFTAKLCGDYELAFGGDGGEFSFHGNSREQDLEEVYRRQQCKSSECLSYNWVRV
jgi:hypothetical protein